MGFAAEALLGRRNRGGGRPVRLRSTPSGLPSGGPEGVLTAREPFMMDEWALSRQEEMQRGAPEEPGPPHTAYSWNSGSPGHRACCRQAPWEACSLLIPKTERVTEQGSEP